MRRVGSGSSLSKMRRPASLTDIAAVMATTPITNATMCIEKHGMPHEISQQEEQKEAALCFATPEEPPEHIFNPTDGLREVREAIVIDRFERKIARQRRKK